MRTLKSLHCGETASLNGFKHQAGAGYGRKVTCEELRTRHVSLLSLCLAIKRRKGRRQSPEKKVCLTWLSLSGNGHTAADTVEKLDGVMVHLL